MFTKIYELEDCWYEWDGTYDDGHTNWNTGISHTYSDNGVTFSKLSGTGNDFNISTVVLPEEFEAQVTYNSGLAYSIEIIIGGMGITYDVNNKGTWYYYRIQADSTKDVHNIKVSETVNSDDMFKLIRQNGELEIYHNDVLKWNLTAPTPYDNRIIYQTCCYNRNTTLKDIKIIQL